MLDPTNNLQLQTYLRSEQVAEAVSLDVPIEKITLAIKDKLERTGTGFSSTEQLVDAALSVNEIPTSSGYQNYTTYDGNLRSNTLFERICCCLCTPAWRNNERQRNYYDNEPDLPDRTIINAPKSQQTDNAGREDDSSSNSETHRRQLPTRNVTSLIEENEKIKDENLCQICLDSEREILLDPCGHVAVCEDCSTNINDCPICRAKIDNKIPVKYD